MEKKQVVVSVPVMSSDYNLHQPTPRVQQPKLDATDRRQIGAYNEDKSHQTKEAIDDIKRVHHKEKQKKELNEIEHQGRIASVRIIILSD